MWGAYIYIVTADTPRVQNRVSNPMELETGSLAHIDRSVGNQTAILSRVVHAFKQNSYL